MRLPGRPAFAPPAPSAVTNRHFAPSSQFENNHFTEMCSGSEAGSYSRLIDFVYHSTLGLSVIKKKKILRPYSQNRYPLSPLEDRCPPSPSSMVGACNKRMRTPVSGIAGEFLNTCARLYGLSPRSHLPDLNALNPLSGPQIFCLNKPRVDNP